MMDFKYLYTHKCSQKNGGGFSKGLDSPVVLYYIYRPCNTVNNWQSCPEYRSEILYHKLIP